MPKDSILPLTPPTSKRNGWHADRHGRIFARVLQPSEHLWEGRGLAPKSKLAVVSFYEGPPSIDTPYSIEVFYPQRKYYYHTRMEVVLVPNWVQERSSGFQQTLDTWIDPYPDEGFPEGARRYYHFYVSICNILGFLPWMKANDQWLTLGSSHTSPSCVPNPVALRYQGH
jgi:hypothetical protein